MLQQGGGGEEDGLGSLQVLTTVPKEATHMMTNLHQVTPSKDSLGLVCILGVLSWALWQEHLRMFSSKVFQNIQYIALGTSMHFIGSKQNARCAFPVD